MFFQTFDYERAIVELNFLILVLLILQCGEPTIRILLASSDCWGTNAWRFDIPLFKLLALNHFLTSLLSCLFLFDLLFVLLLLTLNVFFDFVDFDDIVEQQEETEADLADKSKVTNETCIVVSFQTIELDFSSDQSVRFKGCHEVDHCEEVEIGVVEYHIHHDESGLLVYEPTTL
jgi:hypothetical protein